MVKVLVARNGNEIPDVLYGEFIDKLGELICTALCIPPAHKTTTWTKPQGVRVYSLDDPTFNEGYEHLELTIFAENNEQWVSNRDTVASVIANSVDELCRTLGLFQNTEPPRRNCSVQIFFMPTGVAGF
jgi:hypothetical protein